MYLGVYLGVLSVTNITKVPGKLWPPKVLPELSMALGESAIVVSSRLMAPNTKNFV